ncbi:hypothetical protein QTP88_008590 [Uroleucon formosanum]
MNVENSSIVTASGDSDPQTPAVGSEQAGSRRSSSNDRRTSGVDSQAPGSPNTTSAANCPPATERRKNVPTLGSNAESVASATSNLKSQLLGQQSALNRMLEMAIALKATSAKSKSPQVQAAIGDILGTVDAVRNTHDMVVKAFKTLRATQALADQCPKLGNVTPPASRSTGTQTDASRPSLSSPTQGDTSEGVSREQQAQTAQEPRQRRKRLRQQKQQPRQQQQKQQPRQQQPRQQQQKQQQPRQQQQQQPQQQQQQQRQTWSEVVRKRKPPKPAQQPRSATDQVAVLRKRVPRSMAVTIDRPAEGGSLASVMKKVSGSINLQSLGVKVLTTRKTRTGGILLEVEGNEKATLLAGKIREVVGDAARVRLPEPRTVVLLLGIPEWADAENVAAGVMQAGVTGVTPESVTIRKNSGGRGEFVASLHLPLKDAITLAEKKAVIVEWTKCRVKLLANNQPTCFRCQGKGHLAAECRNEAKPRRCHRCKRDDHLVKDCALQKQTQQQQLPQPSSSSCEAPAEASRAFMVEERVDVALISDPYKADPASSAWHVSAGQRKAAIYVANTGVTVANVISDPEFVSARLNGVQVYSCYASPNRPIEDFQDLLCRLEDSIRTVQQGTPVLVTGDLNARSAAWGDWVDNRRGEELELLIESLGLVIANTGSTPTFTRGAGSIVDVTLSCDSLAASITDWRVLESLFNNSDHHYIRFSLTPGRDLARATSATTAAQRAWNTAGGVANDSFLAGLVLAEWLEQGGPQDWQDAERGATALRSRISAACDFAFPTRRTPNPRKPPVHWWNADIEALRADCTKAKRRMTRMTARVSRLRRRQTLEFNEERADAELAATNSAYREAKKQLKTAILRSKRTCWKELISSVDADPFGKPYKLVMRKLRGPPPTASMEYATLQSVVDSLFPEHRARTDGPPVPADSIVPFTASEVDAAVERAGSRNKAPGPDGLTGKILRAVHKAHPNILLGLYNSCLRSGTFPAEWKTSRVVLLKKGNKPDGVPSSYRPLCLLNDVGKILEFLLARRLEDHMSDSGGLSANQYGFRKGKSTDDAVRELQAYLLEGVNGGNFCLAVSIDVRNAFNTVKWSDILDALPRWRIPQYLLNMFRSYFSGRTGTVHANCAEGGTLEIEISGGVPQGSVVGPLLWNATFDAVMRTELPSGAKLLGFADDTMLVTRAKSTQELEAVTNEVLSLVEQRITGLGLQIAVEKTEAVLFTYKYKYTQPAIKLCGGDVDLSTEMNYLGMVVDRSMLFKGQVKKAAARAAGIGNQLARIMPNVGGPREDRRRLLSSVVHSVLLYGAPSWAHTLELVPGNVQTLNRAQRKVLLRCICAYRTVSKAATNVIASTPPADLLAVERMAAFDRRRAPTAPTAGDVPRTKTMEAWQERWSTEESGSWTRRLIPDVRPWCARSHGLVTNFHLTQFLSGHGCFGQYLHRFRKSDNPRCVDCRAPTDDAEHAFFECDRWWRRRMELKATINGPFTPETVVGKMMESRSNWTAVERFVKEVLTKREAEERERQHQEQNT